MYKVNFYLKLCEMDSQDHLSCSMKHYIMKKYFILFLTILCCNELLALPDKRPIIIEGNWGTPPFEYINEKGKPDGYNIELITTIMKRLHLKYEIRLKGWPATLADIKNGKADLANMIYDNNRAKTYKYGSTVKLLSLCIITRKNDHRIKILSDLNGKSILVKRSSVPEDVIHNESLKCVMIPVESNESQLRLLSEGKYDAAICVMETANYYIKKDKLSNLKVIETELAPLEYCFAGNSEKILDKIGKEFYRMKKDGTFDEISERWLDQYQEKESSPFMYITIGALVLLSFILYVLITILRKKVKKTEKLLRRKTERMSIALRAGDISVWRYDVGEEKFYNVEGDHFPKEGKYKKDEFDTIHKDDIEIIEKAIHDASKGIINDNMILLRQYDTIKRAWKYVEIHISIAKASKHHVKNIIGTYKDVTEQINAQKILEESSRKIDIAIKSANMVYMEIDSISKTFRNYNDPLMRGYEVKSEDLYDFLTFVHPDDISITKDRIDSMIKGENKIITNDARLKLPEMNEWMYCTMISTPFRIDERTGFVERYVGIRINNTEMVKTQFKLEEEKERALQSDKLKSEFLANMSHEIRTPLNSIIGFSNLLPEVEDPKERNQCISLINKNNDMLLRLINDILDLSKIESGTMDIENVDFDLSNLIHDLHSSLKGLYKDTSIDFRYNAPQKYCIINADPNRISQIITNFVTNAFKYTKQGHVEMGYQCFDNGIKIYVEDTGKGIPQDKVDAVFERFEKLGSFVQGAGLGLSICKAIAKLYNGEVGVDSTVGKGSTFWVKLPLEHSIE